MTRDDIYRIAREAGYDNPHGCGWDLFDIELFANLVAATEREACAKVCDEMSSDMVDFDLPCDCADAIRARGQS